MLAGDNVLDVEWAGKIPANRGGGNTRTDPSPARARAAGCAATSNWRPRRQALDQKSA